MDAFPASTQPVLVQWQVDTRPLWPAATQTRQLSTVAADALAALLTDDERAAVLKYFHVRDAKMALVSQLLKHLVVARCGVAWRATAIARAPNGKPVFEAADGTTETNVAFNVSHQAGLVVLVAVYGGAPGVFDVGIDVVSPSERRTRDRSMIADEDAKAHGRGWPHYVDMHADVLSPREVHYLKTGLSLAPADDGLDDTDWRLRHFYALWCLREAYVKMTGDALLAPWLGDLEFRHFVPPPGRDGQVVDHDIRFKGAPVHDARVCLRSVGADYMVCTAVRSPSNTRLGLALATTGVLEALLMDDILDYVAKSRAA